MKQAREIALFLWNGLTFEVSIISPRTGRPKVDNPKDERITVRLDAETAKGLEESASFYGETESSIHTEGLKQSTGVLKSRMLWTQASPLSRGRGFVKEKTLLLYVYDRMVMLGVVERWPA